MPDQDWTDASTILLRQTDASSSYSSEPDRACASTADGAPSMRRVACRHRRRRSRSGWLPRGTAGGRSASAAAPPVAARCRRGDGSGVGSSRVGATGRWPRGCQPSAPPPFAVARRRTTPSARSATHRVARAPALAGRRERSTRRRHRSLPTSRAPTPATAPLPMPITDVPAATRCTPRDEPCRRSRGPDRRRRRGVPVEPPPSPPAVRAAASHRRRHRSCPAGSPRATALPQPPPERVPDRRRLPARAAPAVALAPPAHSSPSTTDRVADERERGVAVGVPARRRSARESCAPRTRRSRARPAARRARQPMPAITPLPAAPERRPWPVSASISPSPRVLKSTASRCRRARSRVPNALGSMPYGSTIVSPGGASAFELSPVGPSAPPASAPLRARHDRTSPAMHWSHARAAQACPARSMASAARPMADSSAAITAAAASHRVIPAIVK